MSHFDTMAARQRKWMFYLLALFVLGAGFTPYHRIFLGLLLGTVFSFYNMWLLQRRVKYLGDAVERNERPKGLGTAARFASAVAAIAIAGKYVMHLDVLSVILGLLTSYIVIVADYLLFELHKSKIKEGESNGT
ncbi:ATP synthase subunit I [Aciduricibacillus chroicocephali]|uniref:ATP synthase subunit I n=1 Tax=Aciduricibacillus chroicocephali TaxID=3054939 RepID=A0ABY9KTF5_9BACI|nr:ATP synthase subunit I [Bacillaceae bacterium 44XB]